MVFTAAEKKALYEAGISRAVVSYWNVHASIPTKRMRKAIALALGITPYQVAARFLAREEGYEAPEMPVLPGKDGPAMPEREEIIL